MARVDLTEGAKGAVGGATTGFGVGGVPGAIVGGLVGTGLGLFGGKKKKKRRSTLDKGQQRLNDLQQQAILGQGPLAELYGYNPEEANSVFEKTIANPAYRNFQENIVPTVTGQFRSEGLQNSSYVGNALSREGRNVQESLDAQRAKYLHGEQQQSREARRNALENAQNRTTFDYDTSNQGGFDIQNIIASIPKEALGAVKNYFTRPGAGGA